MCGVAMDVPLIVFVAVVLVYHAEVMLTSGANQSTQLPLLAQDAFLSVLSVALTVIASGTRAGGTLQAFACRPMKLPFPAAIA